MCSSQWTGELGQIHHLNTSKVLDRSLGTSSIACVMYLRKGSSKSATVETCTNSQTFVCRMTASERQKSPTEVVRMLGAEWKGMSEAQKQPYLDKYEKLKVCSYVMKIPTAGVKKPKNSHVASLLNDTAA